MTPSREAPSANTSPTPSVDPGRTDQCRAALGPPFGQAGVVRAWTVASAVIETGDLPGLPDDLPPGAVLLVENRRPNGTSDWTTPGGVVDEGEEPLDGLTREVAEETGLRVIRWGGLLYDIEASAPDLGWNLRVEVHRAVAVAGELSIGSDPDGIVVGSAWAASAACVELLGDSHPWVREPLLDWLENRWTDPRTYSYVIRGTRPDEFRVERPDR
ncbi:MAG: NUDIX hydrolase [Microthrixaceae bacterium]|nr:NUDIX hydrolase [Microthrixaceae bacterium]MCB9400311.1 NUDIX hydrolase [Microthrixaceae bacterium]